MTIITSGELFEKFTAVYKILKSEFETKKFDPIEITNLLVNLIFQQGYDSDMEEEDFNEFLNLLKEAYPIFLDRKKS